MKYAIKWVINPYRKDKRIGVINPVKRSNYVQHLFESGVGWNEQKTGRKSNL